MIRSKLGEALCAIFYSVFSFLISWILSAVIIIMAYTLFRELLCFLSDGALLLDHLRNHPGFVFATSSLLAIVVHPRIWRW